MPWVNPATLPARFWAKVDRRGPEECWPWTASTVPAGYGQIFSGFRNFHAHRVAWQLANGPIPPGGVIRHSCDNPPCVNPAHLLLGTMRDNTRDMVKRARQPLQHVTHCPQGHPYDEANTLLYQGRRYCRACKRASWDRIGAGRGTHPRNGTKVACPQGHPYDAANTYHLRGARKCRQCAREAQRARRARRTSVPPSPS